MNAPVAESEASKAAAAAAAAEAASEAEARRLQAEGSPRVEVKTLCHGDLVMIKEATNIGMLGQGSGPPPSVLMEGSQTLSAGLAALQGIVSSGVSTLNKTIQDTTGSQVAIPNVTAPSAATTINVSAVVTGTPMELQFLKTAGRRGAEICYGDTVIVQCNYTAKSQQLWLLGSAYSGYVSWAAAQTLDPQDKAVHWVIQHSGPGAGFGDRSRIPFGQPFCLTR
jgi:hypothetical protein